MGEARVGEAGGAEIAGVLWLLGRGGPWNVCHSPLAIQEREHHVLQGASETCLTLAALPEHCGSVPSTYRTELNCNSSFRGMMPCFGFHRTVCMWHTYTQAKTSSCKILKPKSKSGLFLHSTLGGHTVFLKSSITVW